jgi:hypothetical protein
MNTRANNKGVRINALGLLNQPCIIVPSPMCMNVLAVLKDNAKNIPVVKFPDFEFLSRVGG